MLSHYFKIAFRYLSKDKVFSFINIFGLASGLAATLLISMFIIDEFGYDKFNDKADRIFRVVSDIHINGNSINGNFAPPPLGPALVHDFPKIENAVRIRKIGKMLVRKGNENILETKTVYADSSFLDVFTLPMIKGDPHTALVEPYSVVISESAAKKYFNSIDVLGKSLFTDNSTAYTVTGVIKDIPLQSHFHFDFIKSMSEKKNLNGPGSWLNPHSATYLLTKPGVKITDINMMLATTVSKYVGAQLQKDMHSSIADLARNGDYFRYYAIPLTQIHLHSNVTGEFEGNSELQTVYIFVIVASLILLIAGINFIDLSTARSAHRSKEVGVRKVLGASRLDLIKYFLVESVLTSLLATLLGVLIALLLLPFFDQLTGKDFTRGVFLESKMIFIYCLVALVVGLIAGCYPAFYLSKSHSAIVLSKKFTPGFKVEWLRNSMVVFQFSMAIFLIICTLVIYKQLTYIKDKDLGYNREQVLTISNLYYLESDVRTFKEEVDRIPGVLGSTMTGSLPNKVSDYGGRGYFKSATQNASETFLLASWNIDANYIPLLGIKMVKGRNFSALLPTDSSWVLINETAANLLGYSNDPLNKPLYISGSNPKNPDGGFKVLGVVKDFNAGTLHEKISPIVFHLGEDKSAVALRIDMKNPAQLITKIKSKYQSFNKSGVMPFEYSFMYDDFNTLYKSDIRVGKMYLILTTFAISIACLGLFGLISYAAEKKIKEIGIRKILGATPLSIVRLLSNDFVKLLLIAGVTAFPFSYWAMSKWLEDFSYRTTISWFIFAAAGILILFVALATIFLQVRKAANMSPATTLRTE